MRRIHLFPLVLLLSAAIHPGDAWNWPLEGDYSLDAGGAASGWALRLVPRGPTGSGARPVADGALLYYAPGQEKEVLRTSAVPRPTELALFSHGNDFVSAYFAQPLSGEFRRRFPEPPVREEAWTAPWLDFEIWDLQVRSQVNPRSLLTNPEAVLSTEIPPVLFLQGGASVPLSGITAGEVTIVIDRDRLNPVRLPEELRIIRNGQIRSRHRYIVLEDFPSSRDILYQFDASPGPNTIILQALRFDRSLAQRTIRFNAARPALDGP
ncbi:MAG: hypothetical protein EA427_10320 [Spirochaetaceae bacterium]|nr:MAG: hypothetical protein EA427_10320 [Spirochaetaceae bacterium]